MPDIMSLVGKHADFPQCESQPFAALAAGSAADPVAGQETPIALVPVPLYYNPPSALFASAPTASELAKMRLVLMQAIFENNGAAATSGNATNFCDFQLLVYRFQQTNLPSATNPGVYLQGVIAYYSMKVATTIGTAVLAANLGTPFTVTPAAMTGIVPGMMLGVDAGAATFEMVMVMTTTATTFTAIFTQTHAGAATVASYLPTNYGVPLVPAFGPLAAGVTIGSLSAGTSVVATPTTMYGIHVGDKLLVDTVGSGVQETVVVQSVTSSTFKATFANAHGAATPIVTAIGQNLPGQPNVAGHALYNGSRFELQPGDSLKLTRLSNNITGLATNAGYVQVVWWPKDGLKA